MIELEKIFLKLKKKKVTKKIEHDEADAFHMTGEILKTESAKEYYEYVKQHAVLQVNFLIL